MRHFVITMTYFMGHRDAETQRGARVDSAARPAVQAEAHGGDRTEMRTGEGRSARISARSSPCRRFAAPVESIQRAMRLVRRSGAPFQTVFSVSPCLSGQIRRSFYEMEHLAVLAVFALNVMRSA